MPTPVVAETQTAPVCTLSPQDVAGLVGHLAAYHAHFAAAACFMLLVIQFVKNIDLEYNRQSCIMIARCAGRSAQLGLPVARSGNRAPLLPGCGVR